MQSLLRRLPKVDQLLEDPQIISLDENIPRTLLLKAVRETIDNVRQRILQQAEDFKETELEYPNLIAAIAKKAQELNRPHFRRVVNAAGVVIHTNMGRSLMADQAMEAVNAAGRLYSNLEFDLALGRRGERYSHVEGLLCDITGAEAALVVNNNAAAVLIALGTLARGFEVPVSRGELVEIGGAFRIPDVMSQSGAILVEVGTTNKTHLSDYENAITDNTALLLKVHQSNFRMEGFTEQVDVKDMAALAHSRGLPVMEDLGSGSLVDLSPYGLRREPTVQETVAAGVDVTTFSGDKLLGGPQAGIILGSKEIVGRIKTNPLNRAMRIDKFTLAGLEATLRLYLDEEKAFTAVPTLKMIARPYAELRKKAAVLKRKLTALDQKAATIDWKDGWSQVGGGALPAQGLKTRLVTLKPLAMTVNEMEEWFRIRPVPVIGRIEDDLFILDVRTMGEGDFDIVASALAELNAAGE